MALRYCRGKRRALGSSESDMATRAPGRDEGAVARALAPWQAGPGELVGNAAKGHASGRALGSHSPPLSHPGRTRRTAAAAAY
jgi:hypothetical protein